MPYIFLGLCVRKKEIKKDTNKEQHNENLTFDFSILRKVSATLQMIDFTTE